MPSFDAMSHEEVGAYIANNLSMVAGAAVPTRKVAFADGVAAPIHQIDSNLLPHSMFLFIRAVLNQQQVVDGRKMHVHMDFMSETYGVAPKLSSTEQREEQRAAVAAWIDTQLLKLGRVARTELPLSEARRTELLRQLYKQKQNELYCMRSVHLDKDGWLPKVVMPTARNAKQNALHTYISTFTELPGNIQDKAEVGAGEMSAYVEYTAGNKSARDEFSEPRWRMVYDWVNDRFFLTWHYQPRFFVASDGYTVVSPWVYINHTGTSGRSGPATVPTEASKDLGSEMLKKRDLKQVDW